MALHINSRRERYGWLLAPALRRVDEVRLVVGGTGPARAEVAGIGHRHPVVVAVSLRTATRLVEAGAPLRVRRETGAAA